MGLGDRVGRVLRTPAFGIAVITPIMLVGAVAASPGKQGAPMRDADVTPLASVSSSRSGADGAVVVALNQAPSNFHFAAPLVSAPPPAVVVNSGGSMRIPAIALTAYRNAEQIMSAAAPNCGVSWNLLAGIGRIESMHANGGATDSAGTAVRPIYGPALDGTLPGNEIIVQSNQAGRAVYARALGPMQFLPGTWSRYASDGDHDGKADPQNVFDSTLAAARYLCSGGLNLRNQSQVLTAILRYNNSMAYAQNVLGWAAAYATGVQPVDLPAITGPVPAIGDAHLEAHLDPQQGLGPGIPLNAIGLPSTDPLINLGNSELAGQLATGPLPGPTSALYPCEVICLGAQAPLPATTEPANTGMFPGMPWAPAPAPESGPGEPANTFPGMPWAPAPAAPPAPFAPFAPAPPAPLAPAPPAPAPEPTAAPLPPTHGALPGPAN